MFNIKKEFKIPFIDLLSLKDYYKWVKKILWIFGKNSFLLILLFVFLNIIFGAFLFHRYVFLINIKVPEVNGIHTKFKENLYQSVLKELQIRENF